MLLSAVESLLGERIGIELKSLSRRAVTRALRERMEACGVEREAAYLGLLASSRQELETLIESLVVPETWFFRDFEPFVFLRKHVIEEVLPSMTDRPLRILSMPAATGEEPYSIAMVLIDCGLRAGEFTVDAVDISLKAIRKAVRAVYGPHSFREKDEGFRRKYFRRIEENYELAPEVREAVRFVHGNLLDRGGLVLHGRYDVVFFRNLLIYLNAHARAEAVRVIDCLLKDNGLLFLGYAESHRCFFPHYVPVSHPRSYAARKVSGLSTGDIMTAQEEKPPARGDEAGSSARWPRPVTLGENGPNGGRRKVRQGPPAIGYNVGSMQSTSSPPTPKPADFGDERKGVLESARRLADEGKLQQATGLCREVLESDAACADAYCLLGVIALAQGDDEGALINLNKVVYLQPDHLDGLLHLSLIMDKRGLGVQAARYRERARRSGGAQD
jgi:chemotaxis protein methyltransferase WspC